MMGQPTAEEVLQRWQAMSRLRGLSELAKLPERIAKDLDTVLVWLDYFIRQQDQQEK